MNPLAIYLVVVICSVMIFEYNYNLPQDTFDKRNRVQQKYPLIVRKGRLRVTCAPRMLHSMPNDELCEQEE